MGVSKVDLDARLFLQRFMTGHLFALIVGHAQPSLSINAVENKAEPLFVLLGTRVVDFGKSDKQAGSFHQCSDGRRIASPLDQVALPVTGNQAFVHFCWTLMDADHIRNAAPTVIAASAWSALLA